jgi:rhamnopyranosyl-N-acetylglucosaminyl-diphospho-decaprenol beta-1,3/1,4-galactofuranosyltransferase
MKMKVCAVVVTYNRKELLLRCLRAISKQTVLPERVIVVDNASSDGSRSYIEKAWQDGNIPLTWLRLATNEGGAGGFHEGIKQASSTGCTYIWLMDDDGFPSDTCLERLQVYADDKSFIGPIVLSDKDWSTFAFPLRLPHKLTLIKNKEDSYISSHPYIPGALLPFNGVLLPLEIVKKVGLPKKEFFIWGDEIEYTNRIKAQDFRVALVSDAEFFHPVDGKKAEPMFFGRLNFNDPASDLKLYCMCRNSSYNWLHYKGFVFAGAYIGKVLWFYIFTRPSLRKLKIAVSAVFHGINNDFTKHGRYLPKNN